MKIIFLAFSIVNCDLRDVNWNRYAAPRYGKLIQYAGTVKVLHRIY